MDKLNNEELNKVSAGGDSQNVPGLEWMELWLHNNYSYCRYCGTSTRDFEAYDGPVEVGAGVYRYRFLCKCEIPSNRENQIWWRVDGAITVGDNLVK